jgi:hypothetical protein
MSTLREAAQQALEALENLYLPGELERVNAAITALRDALAQQEQEPVALERERAVELTRAYQEGYEHGSRNAQPKQEPVACFIGAKGSAFDLPTTKRAYTYAEQPGNVAASKLGRSLETAKRCSAGDGIDAGLVLLKALQSEGFGVFQLGAEYTHPPRREWQGLTEEDMEDLLPLYSDPSANTEMLEFAAAIEVKLKEKNA